VENADVFVH